jgi:hypothetical protein
MMGIKFITASTRFNAGMNPVLHAVSRLLDSAPGLPGALSAADLSETLSGEPRIRMATRLALVKLAARCEQPDPVAPEDVKVCTMCAPLIARRLEQLSRAGDEEALAGLVGLAPQLRELSAELRRENNPLAVLPQALLELLRAQLH